jgi:ubiquitin carboxyl-terminal hydrolase 7
MMDGENQYRAEGHGLQDAQKGIAFLTFPPVLHMQLKRFEYDFNRDAIVKVIYLRDLIDIDKRSL